MRVFGIMILLLAQPAFADSQALRDLSPPKLSLTQAIKRGQSCLAHKKIDVTKHYLKTVNFERIEDPAKTWPKPRVWALVWEMKQMVRGGQIMAYIAEDGNVRRVR